MKKKPKTISIKKVMKEHRELMFKIELLEYHKFSMKTKQLSMSVKQLN